MKLSRSQICTTTEILKEIFSMPERLIYNMPEKERYNKIYDYLTQLVKEEKASSIGEMNMNGQHYYGFEFEDFLYIIPKTFLTEDDEKNDIKLDEKVVVPFRKAN